MKCEIYLSSKCSCCQNPKTGTANHLFAYNDNAMEAWEYFAGLFGIKVNRSTDWKKKCVKLVKEDKRVYLCAITSKCYTYPDYMGGLQS